MSNYELNLNDYFRIIHKRKFIIVLSFLITVIASTFYVLDQKPIYQASATVKIEERKTVAGLLTEWIVYNPGDIIESEAKIIKGFSVMEKVAQRLGMINEKNTRAEINNMVQGLKDNVETRPVKQTNIIEISATGDNAKKIMDLVNTVAEVYIEENLLEKNKQARTARKFIEEQLASLDEKLKSAEEQLKAFGDEVKGIKVSGSVQTRLTDLEFQLYDLLQRFTDKHPQVKQVREQIRDLENQLKGFSDKELEYARLSREVEVNNKLYAILKEKLEETRIAEAQKISDVSLVDPAVMPNVSINPQKKISILLGGLVGIVLGLILAFIIESVDTSIGTIEEVESITKLSVLGVVPSIRSRFQEERSAARKFLNMFSFFKKTKVDENYIRLIIHHEPKSVTSEAFRTIRTNLKFGPSLKTILITSSTPREGKTTVLTNLGLAIAQMGHKTLLVSSDLRRPLVCKSFGIKEDMGINEVITGVIGLDEAIRNISDIMLGNMRLTDIIKAPGMENIYFLPSGHIPFNPAELLESKEMHNLIEELKERFDVVLFDSPPVLPITDASLLAPQVDGVVLVYEAGRAARSALLRAKVQLETAGAKIFGIVLNHIKTETENPVTDSYYYRYRYEEDKQGKKHRKT